MLKKLISLNQNIKITKAKLGWMLTVAENSTADLVLDQFCGSQLIFKLEKNSRLNLLLIRKNIKSIKEDWQFWLAEKSNLQQVIYLENLPNYNLANQIKLLGAKAAAEVLLAEIGRGAMESKINLTVEHLANKTASSVQIKAVGQDQAKAEISALARVAKKAQNCRTAIKQDILNLSADSWIKIKPDLEILNNQVSAGHAATVGKLDRLAVNYLQSRSLTATQAKNLLVSGFFKPLRNLIKSAKIKAAYCWLIE